MDQKEVEKLLHGRSLKTYLALFHFEEADSVAEKLQIFFGTFAGDLGSAELLVQRRVIVLFIGREVHLVVLDIALHLAIVLLFHTLAVIIVRILVNLCWLIAIITVKV